ncbi:MAG: AarF/UbiB family protein [Archangium sp.]
MTALDTLKRSAALAATTVTLSRKAGRARLTQELGSLHGLPEKLSQLLALGRLDTAQTRLDAFAGHGALPQRKSRALLEKAFGPLDRTFAHVELKGLAASLGQVHRARLRDGRELALKLQYPGIADALRVDLAAFGALGRAARRGYDLSSYRQTLGEMIERELDYGLEAEALMRFGELVAGDRDFVVPAVHPSLCRLDPRSGPPVLAMDWLEGLSLEDARQLPLEARASASRALVRWFLRSLLEWQLIHGDLHPGNLRFVPEGNRLRLGVIDFGCSHALDGGMAGGLRLLLEGVACDDRGGAERWLARYAAMGFSVELLRPIADRLAALTRVLLTPLLTPGTFDPAQWDLSARLEGLLGDQRMAFRVAAPSSFAFVTRAFVGLVQVLRVLDAPVAWRPLFDEISARSNVSQPSALALPQRAATAAPRTVRSRSLRVTITRGTQSRVDLTFPAIAAEGLQGLVPPEIVPRLAPRGIDLAALEARAASSEFTPGELFSLVEPDRMVRVWLE